VALDMAQTGDEIRVAAGVYTSTGGTVGNISQTVTLQGGWNSAFTQTDPITNITTLDGRGLQPVVVISPTALTVSGQLSPTIEGLVVTHGQGQPNDCGAVIGSPQACGGGIASISADPLIVNNVISNNVGANTSFGLGGGIYIYNAGAAAIISGNLVYSNIANIGGTGLGGGILEHLGGATIQGNKIWRNRDSLSGTSNGAGIKLLNSHATIIGNDIRENISINRGGGIHVSDNHGTVVISGNTILSNTAVVAAGGVQINGDVAALIVSNTIAYNQALSTTVGRGGGIRISTDNAGVTITHNDLYSNVSAWGGGSAIDLAAPGVVDGNYLHENQNGQWGAALVLSVTAQPMTATNNVIVNNQGTGIEAINFGPTVDIVNNTLSGNRNVTSGSAGTGILVYFDTAPSTPITATIVNNILVNGAACGLDLLNPPAVVSHHNDVSGNVNDYCEAATSTGNMSADPLFVNAAAGDYHLNAVSLAINAGSNPEAPATDKDGVSRPQGWFVDIGAYESLFSNRLFLPLVER
jgi:hypothetical protein